jgi:hypothetical protein
MDEKYLQSLHSQLGGESVFGKYEDFKNLITRDPQYAKNFYNNFGRDVLGEENDFYLLVKKKDTGVQPSMSQAKSSSSVSAEVAPTGPSVSSATKINKPSAYNKNIESSDWAKHQEITRKIQNAANKKDSAAVLAASKELKDLRSRYGSAMEGDKNLSEDVAVTQRIVSRYMPEIDVASYSMAPIKKQETLVPMPKTTAPIPTKERAAQENDLKKFEESLGSSIDLTEDDLKYMFINDNVQLGTSAEGQAKESENEISVDEAFSDNDGLWNSTKKLYNKFLTSANASLYFPTANVGMTSDAKSYLIKSAQKFAEEKPDGSATEDEILERAKQMMLEDLNKKSREELIEDWARNGGNDAQKQGIANTLGSVIGKINTKEIEFKKKAMDVKSIVSEIEKIRAEGINPENAKRLNELTITGNKMMVDLNENYKYIDNDLRNLSDFQNELDLFKRNYSTVVKLAAGLGSATTSAAKGFLEAKSAVVLGAKSSLGLKMDASDVETINTANLLGELTKSQQDYIEREKSISDIKDAKSFFRISGQVLAQQAPQLVVTYLTGGSAFGLSAMGVSAAGSKYAEIKNEEDYTQSQKILASIGVGLFEVISEKIESNVIKRALPSARVAAAAANGATRLELDAMKAELKSGIKGGVKSTIDKIGSVTLNANQEGVSEVIAQVGGNMVDKYVLNNKKVGLLDGVEDAYLTGAIVGGAITASPIIASKIISPFIQDPDGIIRANNNRIKQLTESLEKVTSQESKDIINDSINKTKKENEAIINGGIDVISKLTPEEIREGVANYEEIQKVKSQFLVIKGDKNLTDAEKKSVMAPLNARYDELVQKRQQLINKANAIQKQGSGKVPVQPKTGTSEKVEQRVPESKSQGATQEGGQELEEKIKELDERDARSIEAVMPNNPNHKTNGLGVTVGQKFDPGLKIIVTNTNNDDNYDGREDYYPVITKVIEPAEFDENGKMTKAAEVETTIFNTKEDADRAIEAKYEKVKSLSGKKQQALREAKSPSVSQKVTPESYVTDLQETKNSDPEQYWSVDPVSEEAAKDGTVISDTDGGALVSKDGDIKGLFKKATSKAKGVAQRLLNKAVDAGGIKLDNFDNYLSPIYKKAGFRVVSRLPFNEEYAPDGWNKEKHGTPDVVAMVYDPDNKLNIEEKTFNDYDEAMAYRNSFVDQARKNKEATVAKEQGAPATTKTKLGKNIKKAIAKVFPDLSVSEFKNAKEMKDYVAKKYGQEMADNFAEDDAARAIFDKGKIVEVLVNQELSDETTMPHEIWHGILSKAFGENEALFDSFRKSIDKALRDNGYEDIADELDAFAINPEYIESDTMASEWLVQFGGMLASARINPSKMNANQKNLLNQLKDIINKFTKAITGQEVFLEDATPENILDFMTSISDSLSRGEDISGYFKEGEGKDSGKTTKAQKAHPYIPKEVFEKLTTDKDGNIVFNHYSWKEIDEVRPSTGSGSLITSKEEQQALSSVGGLAMYYTQIGQKESHVGNIPNTVVVDPSKVYYMNKDVLNFYDEAKEQFLDYMNRNGNKRVNYAFNANYQVAWITKVASEKGFDMVIAKWRNDYDFRAQTKKTLKPEAEVIPFKKVEDEKISVGDKIFLMGKEVVLTGVDDNGVYSYEGPGVSGKIPLENAMKFGKYGPIYKLSSKAQKTKVQKKIDKFLGVVKDVTKITVREAAALKSQIKLEGKAAKAAAKEVNDLRKALSLEVSELAKSGKITAKQAATIIKRIGSVNLSNPSVVDGFVDYMTKVFNDADYSEKVRKANENIKKIKRFYKGKDVQATVNLMAKNFLTIDPKKLSNIDEYLAMSTEVLQAVMPTSTPAGVKMRVAADVAKINDYINAAAKEQAKKVKDDLLSEYQYLIDAGVIDDSMSYDEIVEIIDSIEDSAAQDVLDKGEDVRQYIVKMFNSLSSIGKEILSKGEDPVTGLPVDLSDDQKAVLKKFLNMDIENMSIKDAKLALEYLSNFITNGITDGMAGIVETYSGSENLKTFIKTGAKFRDLKLFFSKTAGKVILQELTNLNILLKIALTGQERSSVFRTLSGFDDIVNGNANARKIASVKLDQYYNKFKDVKDFFTAENNIERGVLAFLVRTNESSDELERRKGLIEQSIEKMMEGNEQEVAKAKIIKEVYERIGKNAKTTQDVFDAAKKENRDAVNWWINNWNSDYDRLKDVSLNIYNTDLGKDKDYTPDVYGKIEEESEESDLGKSAFMMSINDYTVKKKTGVLMEAKKPSRLGTNRVVSFDFDTNNARAYEAALIDIETAAPIRMIDGFINSKNFSKLGNSDDVKEIKGRINRYIGEIRGKNFVPKSSLDDANKKIDKISSIGASMALGGATQPFKQTIPVIINTLINNGFYFDLFSGFNNEINKFIDNSGLPIANRGLESTASIKTADRYLEEASSSKGSKVFDLVKNAGDKYLDTFLKRPDVFVARASFISYYKKELKKRGVDVNGIDWSTHKINKSAAQYAQDMVDEQQNVSDAALMGNLMTSKDPLRQIIKKTVFTFMSFVMNQKTRMYSDIIILSSKQSTKEDKRKAAWSLAALSSEMATFSLVGGFISEMINSAVLSIMGVDEDEEQRAKRRKSRYETVATNISKDFLSPLPFTDVAVVYALNTALDQYYKATEKDADDEEKTDRFRLFEKKESSEFEKWGAAGITGARYLEMIDLMKMAYTGEFEQEFVKGKPTTKYLRDEDKKTLSGLSIVQIGANLGLLPSEATTIVRSATKIAKKRARREEDHLEAKYYKERGIQLPDYLK